MDGSDLQKVVVTTVLALSAATGAAFEHVPATHFAIVFTVLVGVYKVSRIGWKVWCNAEEWLDHRMAQAVRRGISHLPCMRHDPECECNIRSLQDHTSSE